MLEKPNSKFPILYSRSAGLCAVLLLIVCTYFFGLTLPLLGPDEPRYAQVAREMFARGDWITPTLGGAHWFEKPALLYWLQITFYKLFGVSELAARAGSALFGLGTVFCLWILGRIRGSGFGVRGSGKDGSLQNSLGDERKLEISLPNPEPGILNPKPRTLNPEPRTPNPETGAFANRLALIAASSIGLIAFSHGASFDIILTFPLTAALTAFFIFDQSREKSGFAVYFALFAFYFFIGAAMLAKGLIGIVFPFAIVAFYHTLAFRLPSKTFIFSLFWGTLLSLAVAAVWYVPMYQAHGWKFIDEFFIQHHFARYTSNKYLHPQPFPFFFWVLPLMTLPWLPFFLAAVFDYFKIKISNFKAKQSAVGSPQFALEDFAFAWLLVPLVFFTFSGSKLPGYILPALPGALVLTAICVDRFVQRSERRKHAVQAIALATFAAIIIALQFIAPVFARADTTKYLIETADAMGYQTAKIVNLHTISHNAEFYGADRLVRDSDGKLKKFFGVSEVQEQMQLDGGKEILVLVPLEYLHELPASSLVESKILSDNGELAIAAVKLK